MERPILFSVPMQRALLAGRKTQARWLAASAFAQCRAGDRFWVREGFAALARDGRRWVSVRPGRAEHILLRDGTWRACPGAGAGPREGEAIERRWWTPIRMPRWAARLTLVVEAVRHEPLCAITAADAIAEGMERWPLGLPLLWRAPAPDCRPRRAPVHAWRELWDRLHGPGEQWADNPELVALRFRVERVAG